MFKVIILLAFLIIIYILVNQEKKTIKFSFLIYYSMLSIIFMSGLIYISSADQLPGGPIEDGFNQLYYWVNISVYFYLIPVFLFIGYKLFKIINKSFGNIWGKLAMLVLWFSMLASVMYISPFIFILIFYGFAP